MVRSTPLAPNPDAAFPTAMHPDTAATFDPIRNPRLPFVRAWHPTIDVNVDVLACGAWEIDNGVLVKLENLADFQTPSPQFDRNAEGHVQEMSDFLWHFQLGTGIFCFDCLTHIFLSRAEPVNP